MGTECLSSELSASYGRGGRKTEEMEEAQRSRFFRSDDQG